MTQVFRCDGCESILELGAPRLGVVIEPAATDGPIDIADDEMIIIPELKIELAGPSVDFDFCSSACLASWATGRALDDPDGDP